MAARALWGGEIPDWVLALAKACDLSSQGSIAKQLGISPAAVNQTLRSRYKGRLDRIERLVRNELM